MKTQDNSNDPQHIYRQLKLGLGHELVNDGNVFELMALAQKDGNQLLATELREWRHRAATPTTARGRRWCPRAASTRTTRSTE